jgi:predicted acetyltransferase
MDFDISIVRMGSADFKLVRPSVEYKESFLAGLQEFQKEGLPWHVDLDYQGIQSDFSAYVNSELQHFYRRTEVFVPETKLWAIVNGEYAGRISIRHELNDALRRMGGHIGYDTRPTFRGAGLATLMLKHALPIARELGLSEVLLTCDDTNTASIRVIEKCGGVLKEKKSIDPQKPLKRYYWITL